MIKIQKQGKDGKIYDFWQLTEEDKAKMKAEHEARKAEMEAKRKTK